MVSASHTSCNNTASSGGGGGVGVTSGGSVPLYPAGITINAVPNSTSSPSNESSGRQAKVLYDYDAADMKELSLIADEV